MGISAKHHIFVKEIMLKQTESINVEKIKYIFMLSLNIILSIVGIVLAFPAKRTQFGSCIICTVSNILNNFYLVFAAINFFQVWTYKQV